MFDFSDEHKQIRKMLRQWVGKQVEPHNDAMEPGLMTPYEPMRKLAAMLGLQAPVAQMLERAEREGTSGSDASTGPPAKRGRSSDEAYLTALLTIELSRCNPGFTLAFGATLGLCGQTIMRRGTLDQKQRFAAPVLT